MSQITLIVVIIALYLIVWLTLSYFSSKGADNATFFSGNHKMPWPVVAIAMLGAPITGVTFISVPGMVVTKGFSYLQMCLGFIVGYLVIAFVLVPLYYKHNIVSIYGYLERRFGSSSSKTGACLFITSKLLGISIRFLVVCAMLQLLVFEPLGVPLIYCVVLSLALIWLTTFRGGVKSVIWTDVLKSFCLLFTIGLTMWFVFVDLDCTPLEAANDVSHYDLSRIFFLDDPLEGKYFWKQFVAGVFIVIAMTGLDQDMMQRSLACRNARDARKNLITASLMQVVAIVLLLVLGALLFLFIRSHEMTLPEKTDNLFATVAFHADIPIIVGALFILGLISATFASVGSALTAMTTSMTFDVLNGNSHLNPKELKRKRLLIHSSLSVFVALLVLSFYFFANDDALSLVYTVISYTDGPILGLFLFGLLSKRQVNQRILPLVCIAAPVFSFLIQWSMRYYFQFEISYELLLINAALTFGGLSLFSKRIVCSSDSLVSA